MSNLPLGVTASCENCGANMRNNVYNTDEDPICTYRMRGYDRGGGSAINVFLIEPIDKMSNYK